MSNKFFLIDGNSFCYRAFYAIQNLSTSKGEPTNAIYGVLSMLRKILKEEKPDGIAVCFDRGEPTFRHKRYDEYKAHRKPMPDDLFKQLAPIKEFLSAYRIPVFEMAGFEADDVLGTMAKHLAAVGNEVFIVTGDKDALQLVGGKVRVYSTHKDGVIYDSAKVAERFEGLGPERVVDIMSLAGDTSDNIPGVPGIGEKTAVSLIGQFGSLEALMKRLGEVKSDSKRKLIEENKENIELSRELATIDCEVPIKFSAEELRLKTPDEAKLIELFKRFEFRNLLKEITSTAERGTEERDYRLVESEEELRSLAKLLEKSGAFAIDTETTDTEPHLAWLVGLSFSFRDRQAFYVPVSSPKHEGRGISEAVVIKTLKPVLENPSVKKYGQNVKYDFIVLSRAGIGLQGIEFDTMVASYLLNPIKLNHNLDDISLEYLDVKKIAISEVIGEGKNSITMDRAPLGIVKNYASEDADCVFRLVQILRPKLQEKGLEKLFREVEMPLVCVLAQMEINGVKIDRDFLKGLSKKYDKELGLLTESIHKEAGGEFNINSPKQLSEILFDKLKLPVVKKTKTGRSTDVSVLETLAERHRLPQLVLEYRELAKLKSTYIDALCELAVPETGLVHTSFNQTTTATGRLSSSDPNLQNIPIKTEAGREIRRAFVPRAKDRLIVSADYSQIELRLLAHFSGDETLTKAFWDNQDIHLVTATTLFGVKEDAVSRDMRRAAKTVNFSIIYGKTAYGLSKDLKISVGEAERFISAYFERYPGVKAYLEHQIEIARKDKYLTTILGRRAYFPDIDSSNQNLRQFAERAALNAPLQGSAADLIKIAMIAIEHELEVRGLDSLMIIQVHDELVFDVPRGELETVKDIVRDKMENVYSLKVPLKVDFSEGDSWYKE